METVAASVSTDMETESTSVSVGVQVYPDSRMHRFKQDLFLPQLVGNQYPIVAMLAMLPFSVTYRVMLHWLS